MPPGLDEDEGDDVVDGARALGLAAGVGAGDGLGSSALGSAVRLTAGAGALAVGAGSIGAARATSLGRTPSVGAATTG
ncbi:MAG TPA: hypothetical protein VM686_09265, partial [Polyangiaceae bacterium]|nr:hypothetical protein [Polyangiaceae bacterium]